jgi:hypothetical protein
MASRETMPTVTLPADWVLDLLKLLSDLLDHSKEERNAEAAGDYQHRVTQAFLFLLKTLSDQVPEFGEETTKTLRSSVDQWAPGAARRLVELSHDPSLTPEEKAEVEAMLKRIKSEPES